jgi:hypothetical protein
LSPPGTAPALLLLSLLSSSLLSLLLAALLLLLRTKPPLLLPPLLSVRRCLPLSPPGTAVGCAVIELASVVAQYGTRGHIDQ